MTAPPAIQIDPAIYKIPNPAYKHPNQPVRDFTKMAEPVYTPPYDMFGFGSDSARNTDSVDADSYLSMPLESDGITYKTRDMYTSLEETPIVTEKKYKYLRLTVMEVRGDGDTVAIGGIRFLRDGELINNISLWNPHTGDKTPYSGGEWSESDQWTAIFVFSGPVALSEYQIKTSTQSPEMDPLKWKIETSSNASFWSELHTVTSALPFDRGAVSIISVPR